jgi:6-phosphogluconate dehydrogenase
MEIGFVGLGKMGGNMTLRLVQGAPDGSDPGGHRVVGFAKDPNPDLENVAGVKLEKSLAQVVSSLKAPRVVWVMVPAGDATESVITSLADLLKEGDIIIDGGNSHYVDSVRRDQGLSNRGIGFVDAGTSGGIWGRTEGYCMMIGGSERKVGICKPIFDTLAPKGGWVRVGPSGSGHFVKMVHNGIEYGLMEAYAEGFEVLHKAPFPIDLPAVAAVWNRGSVIRSWLLELTEGMFNKEGPSLGQIEPYVHDSGEGKWTISAAMEESVPVPVISAALFARFASRDPENFAARFTAGLRNQFGGHAIERAGAKTLKSTGETKPET